MSVSPMVLERASDLGAVHDTVPWVRAWGGVSSSSVAGRRRWVLWP